MSQVRTIHSSREFEVERLPDGDDGREQDQEPEDVYIPQATEAVEGNEHEGQSERNRTQNLERARVSASNQPAQFPSYFGESVDF